MSLHPVRLIDRSSAKIADLDVALTGDRYSGTICLEETPPQLQRLFEQFEEMVEGQMFGLADEIEAEIEAIGPSVVFANGLASVIEDLQVYPSTKRVSFKIRQAASVVG